MVQPDSDEFELRVNGQLHRLDLPADESLLSVLRNRLGLTGAKYGCGEGLCGACTVLVDDQPVRSCTARASLLAGRSIRTIESLELNGRLHPVQQAFLNADAMQCGFCTTGMIMATVALLESRPKPSAADIRRALEKNICRCGTHHRIVAAILRASHGGAA
ncbi:MAG: (2Fe-2S)-binding protein [Acidobacteria bacterium]|nr:(2Fe-2S)-binding protein [Acidobacteriota bacterium]